MSVADNAIFDFSSPKKNLDYRDIADVFFIHFPQITVKHIDDLLEFA